MAKTMEYNERFLADIVESLLAISRRPLRCEVWTIPDGGFQIRIGGVIPEILFHNLPAEEAISQATGYTRVEIERGDTWTVVLLLED